MTNMELAFELSRSEMRIRDTFRCPNCGSHWIKHIVVYDGVIKGCEMCKSKLNREVKYNLMPFRAYVRDTALELMKAGGII